jgi:hypothetical protein
MLKTLLALILAMGIAASFLRWIDPTRRGRAAIPPSSGVLQWVSHAIRARSAGDVERWQSVTIVTQTEFGGPLGLLTASEGTAGECHFVVDETGQVHTLPLWLQQRPVEDFPDTIKIGLYRPDEHAPISSAQWSALRTLLETLERTVSAPSPSRPLRIHFASNP